MFDPRAYAENRTKFLTGIHLPDERRTVGSFGSTASTPAIRSRYGSTLLGRPTPCAFADAACPRLSIGDPRTIRFTLRSEIPTQRLASGSQHLNAMSGHGSDHPRSPRDAADTPRAFGTAGYRSPAGWAMPRRRPAVGQVHV
jgi:hypothetical protein